jgi:iron(III) transport system permease protein
MTVKKRFKFDIFTRLSIIIGSLILLPLTNIFIKIMTPRSDAWLHIRQFLLFEYIKNTVILIFFVAIGSAIVGFFTAYVTTRYQFRGRKLFAWTMILPLSIPSYIASYIYADTMSYSGVFARLFRSLGLSGGINMMNMAGAIFIFVFTLYPYVYVLSVSALQKQSASYDESARLLGLNKVKRFFKVTLPLTRPALIAGVLLVVLETLNDFGVVNYFNVRVFSFAIFNTWFSLGDLDSAIRLSAILMVLIFFIMMIERLLRGKRRFNMHVKNKPMMRKDLSKPAQLIVIFALLTILALGFIIPIGHMIWHISLTISKTFTLDYIYATLNSITIALIAMFIIIVSALILSNFNRRDQNIIKKSFLKMTNLGYAIPGAVIAIAVNIFFIDLDRALYPIYLFFNENSPKLVLSMSLVMLIFAYTLRFMAIGYNSVESSYDKIGLKYTEASYVLKHSKIKTLLKVDLPLLKPSLISAAIIVFIDIIKELPLTLILRPVNYNTLATYVYVYASDEMLQEASLASFTLIMISSILIYILTHQKTKGVY